MNALAAGSDATGLTGARLWQDARIGWLPSMLILAIVWISFRPFASSVADQATGNAPPSGDIVNQIGFGLIGLFCSWLVGKFARKDVLAAFARVTWFLVLGVLLLSIATADAPFSAFRAVMFSLIVVLAAATALTLPRTMNDMVKMLGFSAFLAVAFSYLAVFFVPEQGVHGGGGFEPQHAGLWRGVYDHKNIASYVMGAFAMIGWFVARNGRPFMGLMLALLSIVFVIFAGSKTVLAILPVAFVAARVARWTTFAPLRLVVIVLPVGLLAFATLGAVLHPPVLKTLQSIVPNLTYTGRTDLWVFGLQYLAEVPWLGYGFESFWGTARVTALEQPIELAWDVRGIVHGHNSWLDSAIAFGLPGSILVLFALVILPIRDFMRIPNSGNASQLATLFLGLWIFTVLGANLESFFFRRSDPVWFCMLLSVIGLRITAHLSRRTA